MTNVIILKFGGSVLTSETALHRAVSEIYRHVRSAGKVIAVVSAFKGETDRLMRLAGSYSLASGSSATPSAATSWSAPAMKRLSRSEATTSWTGDATLPACVTAGTGR